MKIGYGLALAAAVLFGCSSGSKSTRTAGNDTGTTQSGSISGTQGTAAGANGAQGSPTAGTSTSTTSDTSSATAQGSTTPSTIPDPNAPGSTGTQGSVSGSTTPNQGSTTAPSGTVGGTTTYGQGSTGTQGSVSGSTLPPSSSSSSSTAIGGAASSVGASSDLSNLRTVTGSVAKVDENSITLDQAAGGVTLTVDSQTQVIRRGKPAAGISSIREGEQVRASFDPASNRAEKVEVMGKAKLGKHHKGDTASPNAPATPR